MGILSGLFEKKFCDFCGEKLGVFGHTTLKDGYICKKCASQISHWWSIGKTTSVADIHEHLMYRKENLPKVEAFRVTRSLGDSCKVLFDDDARKIMITSSSDLTKANPDVFDFDDVTSARWDVSESKSEITYKTEKSAFTSYDPKRYTYRYDFYITVYVKNPYFDTVRFKVNSGYVSIDPYAEGEAKEAAIRATHHQSVYGYGIKPPTHAANEYVDKYTPDTEGNEDYQAYKALCEEIVGALCNK